jgi:hypothetical protein
MAYALGTPQKQHPGRHSPRDDHGIVAGAARHTVRRKSGTIDGAIEHRGN